MAVELRPMDDTEEAVFLRESRAAFVADLISSGRTAAEANRLADEQEAANFPGGRPAPGHHLCAVVEDGRRVGSVWYGPELGADEHHWWVWDIAVDREHRGRGIGTEVLGLVEAHVRRAGGTALGLSVAGHNEGARRLYERVGYQVAAVRMRKVL